MAGFHCNALDSRRLLVHIIGSGEERDKHKLAAYINKVARCLFSGVLKLYNAA